MATVLTVIGCIAPWSSQAEPKTLDRTVDPIVMECTDFAPLFGVPVEQLALMALEGNTWSPVPFQIDQKKPDGTYAYTTGPRAAPDSDPNLDANDELVFMAGDAGARAEPDALPDAMIAAVELEITDPNNGKTAWAYLGKFEDRAPRSDKDYVKVELNSSTKRWRFTGKEFVIEIPKGYIVPDYLAGIKSDGSLGPDLLDRVKINLEVVVSLINYSFDVRGDHLIRSENRGWIDGPVRVIHYNEGYVQVAKWIKFRMGGKFFSKANPLDADVLFDGKSNPVEEALDRKSINEWVGVAFPEGGMVARVNMDPLPKNKEQYPRLFYEDDINKEDKPEDERGQSAVGMALYNGCSTPVRGKIQY